MTISEIITCSIVILAAVVNAILAIIAIARSREPINTSFFFMSILLAGWGVCVALWQYFGIKIFESINFMIVSLIPAAGNALAISLYKRKNVIMDRIFKVTIILGIISSFSAFMTIIDRSWYEIYFSGPGKLAVFIFMFGALSISMGYLVYMYNKVTYKQEKNKIKYVIAGLWILFIGGMLDLIGGLGFTTIVNIGNMCNGVYSVIIFIAVFKLRLLDPGILFRRFAVYVFMAAVVTAILAIPNMFEDIPLPIVVALDFTAIIAVIYYGSVIFEKLNEFAQRIGGKTASETLKKEYDFIRFVQAPEDSKVMSFMNSIKNNLDMETALYIKEGDYMIKKMSTGGNFPASVDSSFVPEKPLIRYEESGNGGQGYVKNLNGFVKEVMSSKQDFLPQNIEYLDLFKADLILPLRCGMDDIGIMTGKKINADISFTADEIKVINSITETSAFYMKAHLLSVKLLENENMKRIGMMARQMAHEIKNPLASLWGAVQLLTAKTKEEEENVRIIREEIKRLTGILDSWNDFAREVKLVKENFDILKLVADSVALVNKRSGVSGILFTTAAVDEVKVFADKDKIKQVILNVLGNAIDAVSESSDPSVTIEVIKKENAVDLKIRDNGHGISQENLDKIKQPLFTTKTKGTGLGLAISDRIMKSHGGALIIESNGKDYTEVTISIPNQGRQDD